jgi:hypothetical protein
VPDLPQAYVELRNRTLIHLKQIRKAQKKHPEYTVALLIAVASEALSRLRNRKRSTVFVRELLGRPHGVSEAIGRALFDAVRHGLAHRYDTGLITVGKQKVVVVITWKRPTVHLKVRSGDWLHDGIERPGVYLDMETMCVDLGAYFKRFTTALRRDSRLAQQVERQSKRLEQTYTVPVKPESLAAWQMFLADRRV